MHNLEWLGASEAEEEIRKALKIPPKKVVKVDHANFAKIKVQKFFAKFDSREVKANFFADFRIAERESLILDYINDLQSEALKLGFTPPKKLYHKNGLVIREKTPGQILKVWECSDETLVRLAKILLVFKKATVPSGLKKHCLNFSQMKREALKQVPRAVESFAPFRGSKKAFEDFEKVLSRDWRGKFGRLSKGFVHGDFQPQNILLSPSTFSHRKKVLGKISLIDFDRGGYFYPLFDVASFAVQFTHAALLESHHKREKPDRREIRRRVQLFVKEYREGLKMFDPPLVDDEETFRLFKLLIIFNGLAFSTAGFRKKVARGYKHLLFGLFRQELKWFAGR